MYPIGEAALASSRQVWLAGLGAAAVTRDWAHTEAMQTFRALVKEGTTVESRAIRLLGNRFDASRKLANSLWKQARANVQTTMRDVGGTATTLVRDNLPKSLPKISLRAGIAVRPKSAKIARVGNRPAKTAKTRARNEKGARAK